MNTSKFIRFKKYFPIGILVMLLLGCERELSELQPAVYPSIPEVFIDDFSSGLNYSAFGGSVPTAFNVDEEITYNSSKASMRFEVPNPNDPRGAYAGGVFYTEVGRDLSGYDALTFYAKASRAASIDLIGFGGGMSVSDYQVSLSGVEVNTNWKKYIIHIPDPSKLKVERGMFFYSEGPEDGSGYTFWIDEVKFEKLGTIAYRKAAILNGENLVETFFTGVTKSIGDIVSIANMPDGINQTVNITPAYLTFSSSNEAVATVDATGKVMTAGPGNAVISATLGGVEADGSLTIQSKGAFQHAPTPTHAPANVISVYTEAYPNVPVDYYNGYWAPYQTTLSADFTVNGDNVLNYTNFNFVGIQFSSPTINASAMTHLRMDIYIPNPLAFGVEFKIQLVDFGADGVFGGSDNSSSVLVYRVPTLVSQNWISFDIPLTAFSALKGRAHLGQIIFEGVNLSSFYADNIYFRK